MFQFSKTIYIIIVWLSVFWNSSVHAQSDYLTQQTRFHHLSQKQGIRSTAFIDVIEDRNGFIWATASQGGRPGSSNLIKFDGYHFKVFGNDFYAKTELPPSSLSQLLEDREGRIWVGSDKGLHCFFPEENSFRTCTSNSLNEQLADITQLYEDSQGRLWAGGRERAYLVDKELMKLRPLDGPSFGYKLTNRPGIKTFGEDDRGRIWAGSHSGLFMIDTSTMSIELKLFPETPAWGRPHIRTMKKKGEHQFYVGTDKGLWLFDSEQMQVEPVDLTQALGTLTVFDVLLDDGELHWIATNGGLFQLKEGHFTHYVNEEKNEFSLIHDKVRRLMLDENNNLWMTTSDGLDVLHFGKDQFPFYQVEPGYHSRKNYVYRITEDQYGALWIRNSESGLARVDSLGGRFDYVIRNSSKLAIKNIMLLPSGKVWIATNGSGIFETDPSQIRPEPVPLGDSLLPMVNYISLDPIEPRFVWAQTNFGLLRIDHQTLKRSWFDPKKHLPWLQWSMVGPNLRLADGQVFMTLNRQGQLGSLDPATGNVSLLDGVGKKGFSIIRGMVQTSNGSVWMPTEAGLLRITPETDAYRLYTARDGIGLPENSLMSIELDRQENIWLTTQHHICKFDQEIFFCFDLRDQAGFFPNTSSGHLADGRLLFGARNGLYVVDPTVFEKKIEAPKVYLTNFAKGDQNTFLDKSPEYLTGVEVGHSDKNISLEYAALEFFHPENVRYKYRLLGMDEQWSSPTPDRQVTYPELPPGRYTFQVIASTGNAIWTSESEALRLSIKVLPPWYRTWAAYLAYFLMISTVAYVLFQYRLRRQIEKQEARRIKELSEVKTQLYTNITHEFRTPLTLILGPANRAKQQLGEMDQEELRSHFDTIERNGQTLLKRVNQLLDLNKIEAGLMECQYEQADVVPFLKYLLESFRSWATAKGMNLHFYTETPNFIMDYDKEKWLTIVSNLLTNALKYSPDGGRVSLYFIKNENTVQLKIADTGIGIPSEKLPLIFDRFYQVDSSDKKTVQGTGIGLALVQEYVRLLNGHISVESKVGEGTVFKVSFPVTNQAPMVGIEEIEMPIVSPPTPAASPTDRADGQQPLVLVIEDQPDVAHFIGQCLPDYRIAFAGNGKEGIGKAEELVPDFIISDVMMPKMGGFEVCDFLKKQSLTAHIPIILLTAKADVPSKIQGLKMGADAYLTKPFNEEELLVRVKKMIELRQALQKKYITTTPPASPPVYEDVFLIKLSTYLNENLSDYELDVPKICQAMGVSRTQLHRKLKALTGESATRFVRKVRLSHAARLLREQPALTISEVAFQVGFNHPGYFTKLFNEEFGVSPTEYRA